MVGQVKERLRDCLFTWTDCDIPHEHPKSPESVPSYYSIHCRSEGMKEEQEPSRKLNLPGQSKQLSNQFSL